MYRCRALSILLLATMGLLLTSARTSAGDSVSTHPPGTRTGVAAVDHVLELVESKDAAGLNRILKSILVPCQRPANDYEGPECLEGEATGTLVRSVYFGSWVRATSALDGLRGILDGSLALFGVRSGPSFAKWMETRYAIHYVWEGGPPYVFFIDHFGRLAGTVGIKNSTTCEAWLSRGWGGPPQILPPVERCPGPPPPPYRLHTVRILGGPANEAALGIASDDEGNLVIAYSVTTPKGTRIVVQRRNADGGLSTRMRVPGATGPRAAVAVHGSTTFVAFETNGGHDSDIRVLSLGPSSQVLWSLDIGGAGNERLAGMVTDGAGGLYVLGTSNSSAVAGEDSAGGTDLLLARVSASKGDLEWAHLLGGTAAENAIDLSADPTGGVYVVGKSASKSIARQHVAHGSGVFVARYGSDGTRAWVAFPDPELVLKQVGQATAIGAYDDGAYIGAIAAGDSPRSGAGRVVQFTAEGVNHYWNAADGILTDIAPATEAGLGVAGYKNRNWPSNHPSFGGVDAFFSVLDATTGQGDWWDRFGGTGDDRAVAIAPLPGGSFAILGTTDSPEIRGQKNRGGTGVFLAIYASTAK